MNTKHFKIFDPLTGEHLTYAQAKERGQKMVDTFIHIFLIRIADMTIEEMPEHISRTCEELMKDTFSKPEEDRTDAEKKLANELYELNNRSMNKEPAQYTQTINRAYELKTLRKALNIKPDEQNEFNKDLEQSLENNTFNEFLRRWRARIK